MIKAAADVVGVDVLHQVAPENETLKTDRKKTVKYLTLSVLLAKLVIKLWFDLEAEELKEEQSSLWSSVLCVSFGEM